MDMNKMTTMDMNMGTASTKMDMNHNHHGMDGMEGMDDMMKMYFHIGFENHILFEKWTAKSNGAMFGWCALFFCLALAYELLKYYRQFLLSKANVLNVENVVIEEDVNGTPNNSSATQGSGSTSSGHKFSRHLHKQSTITRHTLSMISRPHLIQTALHIIQVFVSYILMLAFMLFNVWICLAIILGAGIGYFLIGARILTAYSVFEEDHCH